MTKKKKTKRNDKNKNVKLIPSCKNFNEKHIVMESLKRVIFKRVNVRQPNFVTTTKSLHYVL